MVHCIVVQSICHLSLHDPPWGPVGCYLVLPSWTWEEPWDLLTLTVRASGYSTSSCLCHRDLQCSHRGCVVSLGPREKMLGRGAANHSNTSRTETFTFTVVNQGFDSWSIIEAKLTDRICNPTIQRLATAKILVCISAKVLRWKEHTKIHNLTKMRYIFLWSLLVLANMC